MARARKAVGPQRAGAVKGASTPVLAAHRPGARALRLAAPRGLPNALTLACLGLGLLAALAAGRGDVDAALSLMALAALADALAGLTAQGLSLGSDLGAELDSLASLMLWGVSVALLLNAAGLESRGPLGQGLVGLVAVAAAWRLCRGDVQTGRDSYQGLPLPVGGLVLAGLVAAGAGAGALAAGALAVVAAWLSPFPWPRRVFKLWLAAPLMAGLVLAAAGWRPGWTIPAVAAGAWALAVPWRRRR